MKKKIVQQPNTHKDDHQHNLLKPILSHSKFYKSFKDLFQQNYQLIARTINQTLQNPNHSAVISKILQREPSIELISFQQIQKNLVFQEYLKQYHSLDKIQNKIKYLIAKHIPNVKANYMDFKIKNFLILNKYKVTEKAHLPYPLCIKFQKLTDSKMSSTKSVENKILLQLQKQPLINPLSKRNNNQIKLCKNKKNAKNKPLNTQRFEIKALTKSIGQMIQNIKEVRALQNFKKQMEKSSQFKFGINNFHQKEAKFNKKPQTKQILKIFKKNSENDLRQKQFKRKVEFQMGKYFPEEKKSPNLSKKFQKQLSPNIVLNKQQKNKFNFKSAQRLKTYQDPEISEYGLSVIRQKRKKGKSREQKSKSKSRNESKKSKKSSHHFPVSSKRLQTEYSSGSTQRLNTGYSNLAKSISGSRIPTEYDSTVIINGGRSKSKQNQEPFIFTKFSKKNSKSSSISSQVSLGLKKSQSKQKVYLLQFNSPNKIAKK